MALPINPALFLIPVVGGILAFVASKSAKAKPAAPGSPSAAQPVAGQPFPGPPVLGQPALGHPVTQPQPGQPQPGTVSPPPFAAPPAAPPQFPGAPAGPPPFFPVPSPASPAAPGGAPPAAERNWQSEVAAAVASRDSARLRQLAAEMEATGNAPAAAVVRNYAQLLDSAGAIVPPFTLQPPQPTPVVFQPPAPAPPAAPAPPQFPVIQPAPLPTSPPSPFPGGFDRALAESTNNHLLSRSRFKEDRVLVGAFQVKEGLKNDGLYGTGTAAAIAKYGIIPAKPYYYPKKNANAKKREHKSLMARYAALDPARREAWLEAARIDHL